MLLTAVHPSFTALSLQQTPVTPLERPSVTGPPASLAAGTLLLGHPNQALLLRLLLSLAIAPLHSLMLSDALNLKSDFFFFLPLHSCLILDIKGLFQFQPIIIMGHALH